jgi:hypothetical protein
MKIKSNFSPRDLISASKENKIKDDSRFRFIEIVEIFWENGGVNNLWLKKIKKCYPITTILIERRRRNW